MKFMKKLAGVLAATVLSVGMLAGTAFADSLGTSKVTLTGVEAGDTVDAYAIATVSVTDSNTLAVDMKISGITLDQIIAAADDKGQLSKTMADSIAAKLPALTTTPAATTKNNELNLNPGYYLLRTTTTSGITKVYQYNIVSVWPTITNGVYVKAADQVVLIKSIPAPTVTKKINGVARTTGNTFEIDDVADGGEVTITIETAIPSYPKDAEFAEYTLTDESSNMTNDLSSLVVKVDGVAATLDTDYTVSDNFTITFPATFAKNHPGASVEITYDATLAIDDDKDGLATNKVFGTFHSSPYNQTPADTNTSEVAAKTYGFYFKKLGANENETPLAGTVFEVKQGNVVVATLTADTAGYIQLDGLANGTYTLHEVSVGVAGFGTIGDFNITLDSTTCKADNPITTNQTETNYLAVAAGTDKNGANAAAGEVFDPVAEVPTLPTTGGIGTIVFSVLGVLIMAAAVVLFVRRKQSEK